MTVLIATLLWLGPPALLFFFQWKLVRTQEKYLSRMADFHEAWRWARRRRLEWREKYSFLGTSNPEYETLWLQEIGAEELYYIHFGEIQRISYEEYCEEKQRTAE